MRCKEEYRALLTKINVQKGNYAEKEMVVSNELEQKIQITTEKIKKWTVRIVIYVAIMMVLLGTIYDLLTYINQKWLITVVLIAMVAIFLLFTGYEIFYKIKLYKLNIQREKEQLDKKDIRENIVSLNDQIASLVVSVITINEHYYELSSIESSEEKIKKWNEYTKEVIANIHHININHPTYTEYQDYYRDYEQYLEDLEKEYENK